MVVINMGRQKITISLSGKCLDLIDTYAQTTGFESRSRVIEEAIFDISELLNNRKTYSQKIITTELNPTPQQSANNMVNLMDTLSRFAAILDRFERFPPIPQTKVTVDGKTYTKAGAGQ